MLGMLASKQGASELRLPRRTRVVVISLIWVVVLCSGLVTAELYARHAGGYERWSWPLRKVPYSARDNLKVWNRRFYEQRLRSFREWPIPIELFDADKPTPRYLFKPSLRMALHGDKLEAAEPGERVYWSSNSWGFRGAEFPIRKRTGVLRVVCLGASTTEGMQGDEETYPYFLRQELSQLFPGREIEVINAGHHGQDIDDLLEILRQRVLPLEPDIILFYEAANNINWPEFIKGLPAPCFGDCWLRQYPDWYGSLYRRSALFDLITESFGLNDRKPPPMPHLLDDSFSEASITHYREVLSEIVREATDRGSTIVLSSFVTIAREELTVSVNDKPLIYREVYRRLYPLTPGEVARVYAIFNQQSAAVARELNVPYADVVSQFPRDPQYFYLDYIHLSPEGDRLPAKLFADFLARAVIPTLINGQRDNPTTAARLRAG